MSRIYIEDLDDVGQYESYDDEQEVVVPLSLLRSLYTAAESAHEATGLAFTQAHERLAAERLEMDALDADGRAPTERLARRHQHERELLANPACHVHWQWRSFGQSAKWRPCTFPLKWSNSYDYRRAPAQS